MKCWIQKWFRDSWSGVEDGGATIHILKEDVQDFVRQLRFAEERRYGKNHTPESYDSPEGELKQYDVPDSMAPASTSCGEWLPWDWEKKVKDYRDSIGVLNKIVTADVTIPTSVLLKVYSALKDAEEYGVVEYGGPHGIPAAREALKVLDQTMVLLNPEVPRASQGSPKSGDGYVYQIMRLSDGALYGKNRAPSFGKSDPWHPKVGQFYTLKAVQQILGGWTDELLWRVQVNKIKLSKPEFLTGLSFKKKKR